MKKRRLGVSIVIAFLVIVAGVGCYFWYMNSRPRIKQGGVLVHEHNCIYTDEQKC